jgi:hypothetical protein
VYRPPSCSITPIRLCRPALAAPAAGTVVPSTSTRPAAAARSPVQTSTVEVLPAPLGPTSAVTWPAGAAKVRPDTAVLAP